MSIVATIETTSRTGKFHKKGWRGAKRIKRMVCAPPSGGAWDSFTSPKPYRLAGYLSDLELENAYRPSGDVCYRQRAVSWRRQIGRVQ